MIKYLQCKSVPSSSKHFASGSSPVHHPPPYVTIPSYLLRPHLFSASLLCASVPARSSISLETLMRVSHRWQHERWGRCLSFEVTLKPLKMLCTHHTRTAWQGGTEEEGLAMFPQQAVRGSRRRANAHPATHGGRERQAVLGQQAEQKHRVRKTKGKAREMWKMNQHWNLTEDFGFCQVVTLTLWHAGLWTLAIRQAQCIKSKRTLCLALSHSRL